MKFSFLANAFINFRNIAILLIMMGISIFAGTYLPFVEIPFMKVVIPCGIAVVYLAFVIQSLSSKNFYERFIRKQKIKHIRNLNYMSIKLSYEAKKYVNSTYRQKLVKVIEDKNEMVEAFFSNERNILKERLVEQALNLVIAYIRLLTNFCKRQRELGGVDVSQIVNRLNENKRKLNFLRDPYLTADLKKAVEMDERIINRLREEKNDLERIRVKLDYIESMVNIFKHQILTSLETEDMEEKLENAINEAIALDNVLEERRRNKLKL